jgi:hypothetical protein
MSCRDAEGGGLVPTTEELKDERLVDAVLFNERGKYKYDVLLDYRGITQEDYEDWDLVKQAKAALTRATENKVSKVTLTVVPEGWSLVCMSPFAQNSYPVMVRGGFAGLADTLFGSGARGAVRD